MLWKMLTVNAQIGLHHRSLLSMSSSSSPWDSYSPCHRVDGC
jgi:hypothetical protein